MHSKKTGETRDLWSLFEEEKFSEVEERATEVIQKHAPDEEEAEEEEGGEPESMPGPLGGDGADLPLAYWDATILRMLSRLAQEEDAEVWDDVEALLPCSDGEIRNLAVGLARLTEGLLIKRMEEMGDPEDSQKSLRRAAQELEDNVLTFQGDIREEADPKDQFLAGFACILGLGKWGRMEEVIENLSEAEEEEALGEDQELLELARRIMELRRRCTPEKVEEIEEEGVPAYYRIFMELMAWEKDELGDLEDL